MFGLELPQPIRLVTNVFHILLCHCRLSWRATQNHTQATLAGVCKTGGVIKARCAAFVARKPAEHVDAQLAYAVSHAQACMCIYSIKVMQCSMPCHTPPSFPQSLPISLAGPAEAFSLALLPSFCSQFGFSKAYVPHNHQPSDKQLRVQLGRPMH